MRAVRCQMSGSRSRQTGVGLSAHDGARLKQYPSNLLVAILGSVHHGGTSVILLSAHDSARLKQYPSNLLVAI